MTEAQRTGDRELGRRIRQFRGRRLQRELVQAISELDPDRTHTRGWLAGIEGGHRGPTVEDLELLARALGVSADAILGIERGTDLDRLAQRYGGRISAEDARMVEGLLERLTNGNGTH
jgi:transcriptional regulator with XRE-family HTH domain